MTKAFTYTTISFPPGFPPQAGVQRSDGATIPADPSNADWQAYQAWLKAGNEPSEPSPQPETAAKA